MRPSRISARSTRTTAGLAVAGLVAGLGLTAPSAQAAPAERRAEARTTAGWLTSQLRDDLLSTDHPDFGLIKLYGPTLDGVLSLRAVQAKPAVRRAMLDAVAAEQAEYVGADGETYVGALGKLATTGLVEGRDMSSFAGGGLLPRLRDRMVVKNNNQKGRLKDKSQYGDYSSTFSQVWGVRALSLGKVKKRGAATRFLLKQQCSAGFFRESVESRNFTCDAGRSEGTSTPDVDATALAVVALKDARRSGVKGLNDDIRDAIRWLSRAQKSNGSFVGTGVSNANSTGLAGWVLREAGKKRPAAKAARWLEKRQVVAAKVVGTGLEGEGGALAYNAAAYREAKRDGITEGDVRSQWLLTAAQAMPGLVKP
jgi:hypothetical protein